MANQSNSSSASEEDHRGLAIVNGNDNGTGDGNEPAEALAEEDTPVDSVVHAGENLIEQSYSSSLPLSNFNCLSLLLSFFFFLCSYILHCLLLQCQFF